MLSETSMIQSEFPKNVCFVNSNVIDSEIDILSYM